MRNPSGRTMLDYQGLKVVPRHPVENKSKEDRYEHSYTVGAAKQCLPHKPPSPQLSLVQGRYVGRGREQVGSCVSKGGLGGCSGHTEAAENRDLPGRQTKGGHEVAGVEMCWHFQSH